MQGVGVVTAACRNPCTFALHEIDASPAHTLQQLSRGSSDPGVPTRKAPGGRLCAHPPKMRIVHGGN
eukprot:98731-Amphidinium_carterae.1